MKKIFLTVIALIAFNGISRANTISDEPSKDINENKEEVLTNPTCMKYASDKCEAAELQYGCMTSSQYNTLFWANYNKCIDKSVSAG